MQVQKDHQRQRPGEMDHYTLHIQKGASHLFLVVSETNHLGNTFLKSETIDTIPVNMVLHVIMRDILRRIVVIQGSSQQNEP